MGVFPILEHFLRGHPEHLDDSPDLVILGAPGEDREPDEELRTDAPEAPHVLSCACAWIWEHVPARTFALLSDI